MKLDNKDIAILVEDIYEDREFWYPYLRLQEAGANVSVVGTGEDTYESKHGLVA